MKKITQYTTTLPTILFFFSLLIWFPSYTYSYQTYRQSILPRGVVGPESFAFDCNGEGPYTGVSDGRIFKWQETARGWREFAVTTPYRRRNLCDGSTNPNLEPVCGRPLGLQFNHATCELFIADAYFGLMKVGNNGGVATPLASSAQGLPFRFTNSLDIDQHTGIVYFTDSSTRFQRRQHLMLAQTGDTTGRFMKYDPQTKQVTVLLRGLKFANGVALSRDKSYVLIAETTGFRILRYWLRGPRATTIDVFSTLPGSPDNIRMNARGQFLVALHNGAPTTNIGIRLDGAGRVLGWLQGDGVIRSVSEVHEHNGILYVGSVAMNYVSHT